MAAMWIITSTSNRRFNVGWQLIEKTPPKPWQGDIETMPAPQPVIACNDSSVARDEVDDYVLTYSKPGDLISDGGRLFFVLDAVENAAL